MNIAPAHGQSAPATGGKQVICLLVDTDFGYLRELAKSLREHGLDTVELINSAHVGETVDNLNPDIVFLNLNATDPSDCIRGLFALKECKFNGRVQLTGRCDQALLEGFRKAGTEASLKMLPPLQKPMDQSVVRKIVREQKLNGQSASPPELSLKKALASNWIQFWYQPQVELENKLIVGAETFVRVMHPQLGMLTPERFLGGASDDDLIALASHALVSALKTSAKLFAAKACVKVAVNISVEALLKLPVVELVAKHRPQDARWPGLTFDITETQVLNKMVFLKSKFVELQKCGISIAIDNVGRGSSSFEMFRHLPFSEIKIDRSFVHGCSDDEKLANICKTMIQFSHNFASKAVAVGIETNADALVLKDLGCDLGQGFLFDRAMSEREFMTVVSAARSRPVDVESAATLAVAAESPVQAVSA
jgi:EAL domain-containing protein (putative c-di-GMP-specific phosphodiesterase class I)